MTSGQQGTTTALEAAACGDDGRTHDAVVLDAVVVDAVVHNQGSQDAQAADAHAPDAGPRNALVPGVPAQAAPPDVLLLAGIDVDQAAALLARFDLELERVDDGASIPGSYWGEPEAGIVGHVVFARADTPVHSLLHEAAHLIVLPPDRRAMVHTDATDSIEEEDAVLVLQALLADALPGVGRARMCADMDAWGYTFRLGSARAYVEQDADGAWAWLAARGLVDAATRTLRFP